MMKQTSEATLNRVYAMTFAKVYPLYIAKAERKGRTKEEMDKIIDELANGRTMEKIKREAE